MKYVIIENLVGGVGWILDEYDDKEIAQEEYNKLNCKLTHTDIQLLVIEENELLMLISEGKLDYL